MAGRSLCALVVAGVCAVLLSIGLSATSVHAAEIRGLIDRQGSQAWLARIQTAASHRNFQGTFVISTGGAMTSAHITHYCDDRNQYERVELMDGQPRRVFRHNDVVHTIWPDARVAVVEQRDFMSFFPAVLQGSSESVADVYVMSGLGNDRVAGHEADVLELKSKDAYRYGYRLWAEKASGLLLRAEVLGEKGEVLESSAFSDVAVNVKAQPELLLQPMAKLNGYRVVHQKLTPIHLDAEGWALQPSVPGFKLISSVKRPLDGAMEPEATSASPSPQVLQSIYSDGLTYVSVFIETFDAQRHRLPIQTSSGATHTLMRRLGDAWWITVVGDVPALTLRSFADALSRKQ